MDGKKLNATPTESAFVKIPEDCLGICLWKGECKSFNVHDGQCDIFDLDRCAPWVDLVDEPESDYFDLVVDDNQCPLTSKLIILQDELFYFSLCF